MVTIEQYTSDPHTKAAILSEDGKWKVLVDHRGVPHLYVRCTVEGETELVQGWILVDDLLPDGVAIEDIMTGVL